MKNFVVCFLFNPDLSKTLVIYKNKDRKLFAEKFNGLGGKIEEGETPHQAVVREIFEETNETVKLQSPKLITTNVFYNNTDGSEPTPRINLHVFYEVIEEFDEIENNEGKIMWVPVKEMMDMSNPKLASNNIPYYIAYALETEHNTTIQATI